MREAVLGNGSLALCFDPELLLKEAYWPVVGLQNHVLEGRESGLFLSYGDRFCRVGAHGWKKTGHLGPGMFYTWNVENEETGIAVKIVDSVDPYLPVWGREIEVRGANGPLALYMLQSFALGENTVGECASYDSTQRRLYHFKGNTWLAIEFSAEGSSVAGSVSKVRDGGISPEQIFDGHGPISEHGLVESCVGVKWIEGGELWARFLLAFGKDRNEADRNLDEVVDTKTVEERSRRYWCHVPKTLSHDVLVVAAHCDREGAIIAAFDTDIMGDYRDHYRYVWPRDGALCAKALLRANLPEYAKRYLSFCQRALHPEGFFWQRYRPDATRGSGWYALFSQEGILPIQEDETALSLALCGNYLAATGDLAFIAAIYDGFVRPAAEFILGYTCEDGTLVRPSYDMWEERRGVFAVTQASCIGALSAAHDIAAALSRDGDATRFASGTVSLLRGLLSHLSSRDEGFFRAVDDSACDGSMSLIPLSLGSAASLGEEAAGLIEEVMERSQVTWRRIKSSLSIRIAGMDLSGIARYRDDWYCRPEGAGDGSGNPWPVTTGYFVLSGLVLGEISLKDAADYLRWFDWTETFGGLLPEQMDCVSGSPRSVCPLAWSHAVRLELSSILASLRVKETNVGSE